MTSGHHAAVDPGAARDARWTRALRGYLAGVITLALVAVTVAAVVQPVSWRDLWTFTVLAVVAITYEYVARRVEAIRRRTAVGPYVTMDSVWVFSAAFVLPAVLASTLVVLVVCHAAWHNRRAGSDLPATRVVFNAAATVLPAVVVSVIAHGTGTAMAFMYGRVGWFATGMLVTSVVAYAIVNTGLVGIVIMLAGRHADVREAIGTFGENAIELATLALGALVACAISHQVLLALFAIPVLALLQRVALVEYLESAASEDSKTGLLNAAAWEHMAGRELARAAGREVAATVMLIDLDHFKRVNDTYGHLSGDAVLKSVADCMAGMLRDRDLLSRFGGEEFVALLPGVDAHEALRVAERIRARIADVVVTQVGDPPQPVVTAGDPFEGVPSVTGTDPIKVTVSVGLASYPQHAESLTGLLAKADTALYVAKQAGRNRVRVST